jgi:hypothetical protein
MCKQWMACRCARGWLTGHLPSRLPFRRGGTERRRESRRRKTCHRLGAREREDGESSPSPAERPEREATGPVCGGADGGWLFPKRRRRPVLPCVRQARGLATRGRVCKPHHSRSGRDTCSRRAAGARRPSRFSRPGPSRDTLSGARSWHRGRPAARVKPDTGGCRSPGQANTCPCERPEEMIDFPSEATSIPGCDHGPRGVSSTARTTRFRRTRRPTTDHQYTMIRLMQNSVFPWFFAIM